VQLPIVPMTLIDFDTDHLRNNRKLMQAGDLFTIEPLVMSGSTKVR
jgi:hypothetical protein